MIYEVSKNLFDFVCVAAAYALISHLLLLFFNKITSSSYKKNPQINSEYY